MEALKIVGLCIVAAIVYGILHDQVTARVCVEYFTIGRPRIDFPTMQCIWPATTGAWPWDEAASEWYRARQPLLDSPGD